MATAQSTAMTDHQLYRLMAWLSPSFPVGAFTYSHGLETAVERGYVTNATDLSRWLTDCLRFGTARNDAILLCQTMHCCRTEDHEGLKGLAEMATALAPTAELRLETMAQGRAFLSAIQASWPLDVDIPLPHDQIAYPVAVGLACAGHAIEERQAISAYLHAFTANLTSAGVRLIPLGQTAGLQILAALEPIVLEIGAEVLTADLDDLGGATLINDLCSMQHEIQYTRLFRS